MKDINNCVDMLVDDIDEIPEDVPSTYVVWAVGYDEDDNATGAEMVLAAFEDPDQAVHYAKNITLADVVNLAADDDCDCEVAAHSISIEIEAVVNDEDGCAMGIGVVYKKTIEVYEELPEFVTLSADDYTLLDDGNIMVPKNLLPDYNTGDCFTAVFNDNGISEPMIYKIKSTVGEVYVCEFV
jgi:hypothetical protein